jgi:hypothetical protein
VGSRRTGAVAQMSIFPRHYAHDADDYAEVRVSHNTDAAFRASADETAARRLILISRCIGHAVSAIEDNGTVQVRYHGERGMLLAFRALERLRDAGVDATIRRTNDHDLSDWTLCTC